MLEQAEKEKQISSTLLFGEAKQKTAINILKKGSKCGIVGTLQTRSYDAQDGSKRYVTEVVADEVEFISTNRNQDGTSREDAPAEDVTELKPIDDDSLPF